MRNQRRSHSLQPINRAPIADPQFDESHSLVSTNNLAQALLLQTADQRSSDSSSSSSSSPGPDIERSPPVRRRTTPRPNCPPPPPPPRPPSYTSAIFDRPRIPFNLLNEATVPFYTQQRQNRGLRYLLPDPTNTRPCRSPLAFEPTPTVSEHIDLINDVKKLIIRASELHQDIEVKLTRIQLRLLREEFERQDEINNSTNLH
jgi:hypothetical protein